MSEYIVDGVKFSFSQLVAAVMEDGTKRFTLLKNSDCYKDNLTTKIIRPCVMKVGAHLGSTERRLKLRHPDTARSMASGSTSGSLEM